MKSKFTVITNIVLGLTLTLGTISFSQAAGGVCDEALFTQKICISSVPQDLKGSEMMQITCEDRGLHQTAYDSLIKAFHQAPAWFQQRLCNLNRIGVYPLNTGTTISWSYAALNSIGISKLRMDQNYDLSTHAQIMQSQAKGKKTLAAGAIIPQSFGYKTTSANQGAGLLYLFAHEMGHVIYNVMDINLRGKYFHQCNHLFGSYTCPAFKTEQFGFIDWLTGAGESAKIMRGEIKPSHADLRSYVTADATKIFTEQDADGFFRSLNSSSFVSAFALYSPEEDFCETFVHLVMAEAQEPLSFHYLSGETVDIWERVRHPTEPVLKEKIEFVKSVLPLVN